MLGNPVGEMCSAGDAAGCGESAPCDAGHVPQYAGQNVVIGHLVQWLHGSGTCMQSSKVTAGARSHNECTGIKSQTHVDAQAELQLFQANLLEYYNQQNCWKRQLHKQLTFCCP